MRTLQDLLWSLVRVILATLIVAQVYRMNGAADNPPQASPAIQEKLRNRARVSQSAPLQSATNLAVARGPQGTNPEPPRLQSVEAAKPAAPPRVPVYVIPELIEVRIPGGMRFIFVEQHHMQELAKKFPAIRYTNIVIYNDGL